MKGWWILLKAFSSYYEMIMWIFSFNLLIWWIMWIGFQILSHPHIPGMKPTWSSWMIVLMYFWMESKFKVLSYMGLQIKTTLRFHPKPNRMPKNKSSCDSTCWWVCRTRGTLPYCWWDCRLVQPLWETIWLFFRKLEIVLPEEPVRLIWAYIQNMPHHSTGPCAPLVHSSLTCNNWKQPRCPSIEE